MHRSLVTLVGMLCFGLCMADAHAQPCTSSSTWTRTDDAWGNPSHKMFIYIEHDIHEELRDRSTTSSDDDLSFEQVRNAVMTAAEIWNNETQAMRFVYGGAVSSNNPDQFCSSGPSTRPAVYVQYDEDFTGKGQVHSAPCANARSLRMGQAWDVVIDQDPPNGDYKTWGIGSQTVTPAPDNYDGWFTNVMVHEFGHVVGLDDIGPGEPANCTSHASAKSVMDKCKPEGTRHPLNWDKNCARNYNPDAKTSYRMRGFSSTGSLVSNVLDFRSSRRSGLASTIVYTNGGTPRHSLWYFNGVASAYSSNYDGYFAFYDYYMDAAHIYDLYDLDVVPAVFRAGQYSTSSEGMRVSFVDDENDSNGTQYNPPYAQLVQTDAVLGVTPSNDYSFDYCGATSSCGVRTTIRSHLPVIGAKDPVSGRTIHAWVRTRSDDEEDGDGEIFVSSGLYSTSNPDWLAIPVRVTDSASWPTINSDWNPTGRTDVPPSVACADSSWNAPSGGYNCVIAWTDKGQALTDGPSIHYRYFRVNSNDSISWAPGNIAIRGGSETAAGPAVGFFADKMWMAWKDISTSTPQIRVYNSTSPFGWSYHSATTAPKATGQPSFSIRDGYESVLVWAESSP